MANTKTKATPISSRSWERDNKKDKELIELLQIPGPRCTAIGGPVIEKVRLRAHLDTSYDFQSWAKAEVWTAAGWTEVHHIPGVAVRSLDSAIEELRRVALEVLR